MPIERLIYSCNENQLGLEYNIDVEGIVKELKSDYNIRDTIRDGENYFNKSIMIPGPNGENLFRMGWESVAVFIPQDNLFRVRDVYKYSRGAGWQQVPDFKDAVCNQITTQAIDTCTLIYIETGEECLLAHFNESEAGIFTDALRNGTFQLDLAAIQDIFFSGLALDLSTREDCKAGYANLKNLLDLYATTYFDRTANSTEATGNKNYFFSHIEFGISREKRETRYFGDLIFRPENDHGKSNPSGKESYNCYIFEYNQIRGGLSNLQQESLELVKKELPGKGYCGGGGCVVI